MASDLQPKRSLALQPSLAVTTAKTVIGEEVAIPPGVDQLVVQAIMTYGSSGTAIKVYVQTSLDNGVTWVDVICITFATTTATKVSAVRKAIALAASYTPTDGTLGDDSIKDGLFGDRMRTKTVSTGTYADSTTVEVQAVLN